MTKIYSKALNTTIEVSRLIGHIKGSQDGPTLVFFAGIHGNEPSGVFALNRAVQFIKENKKSIKGNIYAFAGNLWALERQERFHTYDLNRMWTKENLEKLDQNNLFEDYPDFKEMADIYASIKEVLKNEKGPFYFMDLHTTSAETIPFLTVNDSLLNRKFAEQYPLPIIFGIEEYLHGPLLSYLNEHGYIAMGYEGGRHDDASSIENHISFIYLSLLYTGCIEKEKLDYFKHYGRLAKTSADSRDFYEIFYRYKISEDEDFKMEPGYINFQKIRKGQTLATSNGKTIKAIKEGRIFMPLYQKQGDDGFFGIHRVSYFRLKVSVVLRKLHFDRMLPLLPGVNWASKKHDELLVNRKIARLFAKPFFHILGYRAMRISKTHLMIKNREPASRKKEYRGESWN